MPRFIVSKVIEIVGRGRGVTGQPVDGKISMGMVLHPDHIPAPMRWRVIGIESVSRVKEFNVGLFLENAPELDELRRLLPPGTTLVTDD